MKYNVRFYQPGDEEHIVHLLKEVWNDWPQFDLQCASINHWRWKYQNSLKEKMITLAELEGNLIGCLHTFTSRIKVGKHEIHGSQGADAAVHPDYRQMGVYNSMDDLYNNITLNYSLSGNPIVFNKAIRNGGTPFPTPLTQMVRILDIDKHLETKDSDNVLLKKYGFKTLNLFYKTLKKFSRDDEKPMNNYKITSVEKFNPSIDVFWDKIKNHYDFILIRDRKYLNWRYCDSRGGNYKVFIIARDGEIIGYCVLRVNKYDIDYPVGNIVDMITLPNEETSLQILFNHASRFFDEREINFSSFLCVKNSLLMKTAMKHGFVNAPRNFHMWFPRRNSFKTDFLKGTPENRLHFTLGDTDWI